MKTSILASLAVAAFLIACLASAADPTPAKTPDKDAQELVFLGEARPVLVRLHVHMDGKPILTGYDDFMKYLFDYLDVNGDGVLNKEEAERAPGMDLIMGIALGRGPNGRGAAVEGPSFDTLDTDRDGKVTRAELAAYYRKNGFVPFQFHLESPQANPINAAAAFFGGARPEPSVDAVSKAIFQLLDTDGDGKLTRKELAAAPMVLLELDENEDELVTTQELVPYSGANLGQMMGMMAMGRQGKSKATSSPTLVPVLTPGEIPADLVSRMQDRYSSADKKLSQKDLGLDDATFHQLDTNGDGVLDGSELGGFIKRPPDLELVIRLGKKEANEERVSVVAEKGRSPLADKVQGKDNQALLDLGKTRIELRGNDEKRPDLLGGFLRQQAQTQFRVADTNNDGFLDAGEARSGPLGRVFKSMDRAGTGKVSEKQMMAYLDHLQELHQRAGVACVMLEFVDQSRGLFDLLDTNRTGRLSVRAMREAPRLLEQLDRAGKGYITRNDIPHSYRLEVRRGPNNQGRQDPGAAFFERYMASAAKSEGEPALRGPLWFRKMDRNRDGDVSRKEFLFGEERFRQIDADGDGLISVEEAERYEAGRREQK